MIGNTESENQILRKLSVIPQEKWIRKNHGEFIEEIIKLENHKEIVVKLIANSSWINADFRGVLDHWLATNAEKKADVKIIHESIEIFVRVKESFANVDAGNEEIDVKKWRSNGSPFAKLLPKPIWVDLLSINKSLGLTNTVVVSIVFSCLTMYLFNKILWLSLVTGLIALMVLLWLLTDINMFIKYTKASHLFGKRKYIEAIYLYSEILNLEQELGIKDYKLVCDRADAYRKIGDSEVASGYPMMKVHQSRGYAEALKDYDRALDIKCDYFPAWNNRGLVLQKLGFHQAALDSYTAAISICPVDQEMWMNRGRSLQGLGKMQEAYYANKMALKLGESKKTISMIHFNMGLIAFLIGNYMNARDAFQQALVLQKGRYPKAKLYYLTTEGKLSFLDSNWSDAYRYYSQAISVFEQMQEESSLTDNISDLRSFVTSTCYVEIIDVCVKLNNVKGAIEYLEKSKGFHLRETLTKKAANPMSRTPDLMMDPMFQGYANAVDYLFKIPNMMYSEGYQFSDISLDSIEDYILNDQCTLIEYCVTASAIYAFVLSSKSSRIFTLKEDSNIDQSKFIFDRHLSQDTEQDNYCYWSDLLKIQEVMNHIMKDSNSVKKLIIIPHVFLHNIPIHALPISSDNPDQLLIDYFSDGIQYSPSCVITRLIKERQKNWKHADFNYNEHDILSSLFAIQNPTKDLVYASLEVDVIKGFCGNSFVLSEDEATKEEFLQSVNIFGLHSTCLHFACHGEFNVKNSSLSALVFADGKIELREMLYFLASMPKSPMVVLSACETALSSSFGFGDEYVGIPSLFLTNGAFNVIGGLWRVDDVSTSLLIIKFYQNLKQSQHSVSLALNQAQQWLRFTTQKELLDWAENLRLPSEQNALIRKQLSKYHPSDKPFYEPQYWAAFCSIGAA